MKTRNAVLIAGVALLSMAATEALAARGGHGAYGGGRGHYGGSAHYSGYRGHYGGHSHRHVGVFIGAPVFAYGYGWYPPYPYYYPPAYAVQPVTPPVYVERADEGAPPTTENYWYYCPDTKAYYPYVGTCASPWQRVAPQPPQS